MKLVSVATQVAISRRAHQFKVALRDRGGAGTISTEENKTRGWGSEPSGVGVGGA